MILWGREGQRCRRGARIFTLNKKIEKSLKIFSKIETAKWAWWLTQECVKKNLKIIEDLLFKDILYLIRVMTFFCQDEQCGPWVNCFRRYKVDKKLLLWFGFFGVLGFVLFDMSYFTCTHLFLWVFSLISLFTTISRYVIGVNSLRVCSVR